LKKSKLNLTVLDNLVLVLMPERLSLPFANLELHSQKYFSGIRK